MKDNNQISPFVLWGQDDHYVTLKIELRSVQSPKIDFEENKIQFQSFGVGLQGANDYQFEFDFYDQTVPEKSLFKVNENSVEILIKKQKKSIWPRLTINKLRRAWLKVNFEKSCWNEIDDEEAFGKFENDELDFYLRNDIDKIGNRTLFENKATDELIEQTNLATSKDLQISRVEFMRKFYLILYDLIQLYGSVYLLTSIFLRYDGSNSFLSACRDLQSSINFLCYIKIFEILHQMFGFVFNKDWTVWHLVINRIVIFCILIELEPRLITKPVVIYLVLLYAILDIINYIYYIIRILEIDLKFLKYLKCTIWIPIYPMIFLCEAVILLRSIPYYHETKRLNYELPNNLNFSFPFLQLLRFYLFIVFIPVMYFTMNNLYRHRLKSLCSDDKKNKKM